MYEISYIRKKFVFRRNFMQKVIPAILTSDPEYLRAKLQLFQGESEWLHIDIMDGTLVPGRTVNLFELGEASEFFNLEIHLMVEDPFKYFEDCSGVRAKRVLFHAEAIEDIPAFLEKAKNFEFQKSVALGPNLAKLNLEKLSLAKFGLSGVLLMGIEPGAQGREFIPSVLEKIREVRGRTPYVIGVDGGVKKENIKAIFQAGADYVVVGSEIMKAEHPLEVLKSLEEMVQSIKFKCQNPKSKTKSTPSKS